MPEIGKTYLGKVVRLAEFGAFVEIFPGTDGLLHVSEIAEHRVKEVKDELREGDQILVKVLAIEGNRIKLSRKAVLREQRAKLGLPAAPDPSHGGGRDGGGRDGGRSGGRDFQAAAAPVPEPGNIADDDEFEDDDEDVEDGPDDEMARTSRTSTGRMRSRWALDSRELRRAIREPGAGGPGGNRRPGGRRRRGGRRPGQGGGGGNAGGGGRPQS